MVIHQQRGRASAGPREQVRTLDADELARRRADLMQQAPTPERAASLARLRCQARSIRNRVAS